MKRGVCIAIVLLAACGGDPIEPERSLVLEASPSELTSDNGTAPSTVLRAFVIEDGARRRVAPSRWIALDPRFGSVDAEGRFVANGSRGGVTTVAAQLDLESGETLRAETSITVRVRRDVIVSENLSPSIVDAFDSARAVDDPRRAPFVRYPLEDARMPNDVAPPEVQWDDEYDSGGRQDPLRVTVQSAHVTVHGYLDRARTDDAWALDAASWALIANDPGEVGVEVARLGDGTIAPSDRVTFTIGARALHLAMIAWELSVDPARSRLIELGEGAREVLDLGAGDCTGCHTVGLDDDRIAATVDRFFTGIYDLRNPAAPIARIEPPLDGVAFQPGGSLLIGSRDDALLAFDRTSGAPVSIGGLPTSAGFASWSGDGRFLAFAQGGSDRADGTSAPASIAIVEHQGASFGTPAIVHDGASASDAPEGGSTDSHPTFSPDGEWIAFAHGTASHAAQDARSAIYLVRASGGEAIRLATAMGPEGDSLAFWPSFAPRATVEPDGTRLYWLAFYSRMPYGNDTAGTRGEGARQLWVAAIEPSRSGDPSHRPFRVGGQRTDRDHLGAAWRAGSCFAPVAACTVDSQCCSSNCVEGVCAPAPTCGAVGAACDVASPCCGELMCDAGQCVEVIE